MKKHSKIRKIIDVLRFTKNWSEIIIAKLRRRNPTRVLLANGMVVGAPPNNTVLAMIREIFIDRVYTPSGLEIREGDIVVDIGANIGLFALFAASQSASKVYAFEPFPENVEYITRNINTNNIHSIIVEQAAIFDKTGTTRLYLGEISGGHLLFDKLLKGHHRDSVDVQTKTLAQIMSLHSLDRIDLLKMDCEGAEGHILKSLSSDDMTKIRQIAMEFHDTTSMMSHEEIEQALQAHGFTTWKSWDGVSKYGYIYARKPQPQ